MKKIDSSPKFKIGDFAKWRGNRVQIVDIFSCHYCPNESCEKGNYRHFAYKVCDKNYKEGHYSYWDLNKGWIEIYYSLNDSPSDFFIAESKDLEKIYEKD